MRPVHLASLVALAVPLLARAAFAQSGEGLVERDTVQIQPHDRIRVKEVDVDNRLGNVIVLGHDSPEISLTVVKRAPDEETLDRLKVNLVPDPSGKIRIGAALLFGAEARPVPAGSVRIDITVLVPRDAGVDVKAWNGKISVTGMRAGARLLAHDADIVVNDVEGAVSTSAARGRQVITDVNGAVAADGAYADLSFDAIRGDSLAATVHDGTITARHIRPRTVKMRTTFGRIVFHGDLMAMGHYDLRSYRGDVEVRFPARSQVQIQAVSRDGAVESQLELAEMGRPEIGRLSGVYGAGRKRPAILEVHSVMGSVRLGLYNE